MQGTRKLDCPASLQVRAIGMYTEYTLELDEIYSNKGLRKAKASILKQFEDDRQMGKHLNTVTRYYFKLPLCTTHSTHPVGEAGTVGHSMHPKIADKIRELVSENITSPEVVRKCLAQYVEKEMFGGDDAAQHKPRSSNRRYYPSRQDLRSHIARAISASKYCSDDQESLKRKVEEWSRDSPTSKFHLRTRDDDNDGNETKFMFVHQEEWQQRLLLRYGSDLVLMDATYKTTKYAIPLFFLCVHTNVGYKVVAEFLCQNEDKECIAEDLSILKSWNPTWDPKYFMVDYSTAEISAIENQFPDVAVYICDFHRVQAWQRWVKAGKNGLTSGEQAMFLEYMQHIARARSEESYHKAVESLRKSKLYVENSKVEKYCEKVWLNCSERWAHAFRVQQAVNIVNTNNGVEAQNKVRSLDKSVFGIAVMIVESFVPDSYQHYLDTNLQLSSSYRQYNRNIPDYLHNRPIHFAKHCLNNKFAAAEYEERDVKCVNFEKGEFLVRSCSSSNKLFAVKMSEPSCQCDSWRKTQFPCKHFFAVFEFFEEWDFNSLPHAYRNSVFITLDTGNFSNSKPAEESPLQASASDNYASDDCSDGYSEHESEPQNNLAPPCQSEGETINSDEDEEKDGFHTSPPQPMTGPIQPPSQISNATKARRRLQERIDVLRSVTFRIDDGTALENAISMVETLITQLQKSSPHQNGLPLRQSPVKKRLKVTEVDYHKVFHKKLPTRRWRNKKKKDRGEVVNLDKPDMPKDNVVVTDEVSVYILLFSQELE